MNTERREIAELPSTPIFVYGSLMYPSVLTALLGRCPPAQAAVLTGFRRLRIRGEVYPALVQTDLQPATKTQGRSDAAAPDVPMPGPGPGPGPDPKLSGLVRGVVLSVSPAELSALDAYEDEEYTRRPVEATLVDPATLTLNPFAWATLDAAAVAGWEVVRDGERASGSGRSGDDGGDGGGSLRFDGGVAVVRAETYVWEGRADDLEEGELAPWLPEVHFAPHEDAFVDRLLRWA